MTSKKEPFYIQRIAKLEKQVAGLIGVNEILVKKNAELTKRVTELTDKVATLETTINK